MEVAVTDEQVATLERITGYRDLDTYIDDLIIKTHIEHEAVLSLAEGETRPGFDFATILTQLIALVDAGIIPHTARINQVNVDFSSPLHTIQAALQSSTGVNVTSLVLGLLPFILVVVTALRNRPATTQPAAPPAPVPIPSAPPAPTGGAPMKIGDVTILAAKAEILRIEGPRELTPGFPDPVTPGIQGASLPAGTVQQVGVRFIFNVTPNPDNPAYNDVLVIPGTEGNFPGSGSPCWLPRWGVYVNGEKRYCSKGADGQPFADQTFGRDLWSLETYAKKNKSDTSGPGLTPGLLQVAQAGPGQTRAFFFEVLDGQYNNDHPVITNEVNWQID